MTNHTVPLRAGSLLVATPLIDDPNFEKTVVYLIDHGEDGSAGIVINRLADTPLSSGLAGWTMLTSPPVELFTGGPVGLGGLLGLGLASGGMSEDLFSPIDWPLGAVDLEAEPSLLEGCLSALRIFSGYTGWGPGQLDGELGMGAWWVFESEPLDVFCAKPNELWHAVLQRQGGPYRLYGFAPDDPTLN